MSYHYADESESDHEHRIGVDLRFHRSRASPSPPHRRTSTIEQPRYHVKASPRPPVEALMVTSRGRRGSSCSRSRSRQRRSEASSFTRPQALIVRQALVKQEESESSLDDSEDGRQRRHRRQKANTNSSKNSKRYRGYSSSDSDYSSGLENYQRSHYRANRQSSADVERQLRYSKQEWEMANLRRELEQLEASNQAAAEAAKTKEDSQRILEQFEQDHQIRMLKARIEKMRAEEEKEREEEDLKIKWELEKAEEVKKRKEEEQLREELAKEAIRKYELELQEKAEEERMARQTFEREYRAKLQQDLIASGVDEKDIQAILNKETVPSKVQQEKDEERAKMDKQVQKSLETAFTQQQHQQHLRSHPLPPATYYQHPGQQYQQYQPQATCQYEQAMLLQNMAMKTNQDAARPTYTRMSRRHVSFETLATFSIDYELDHVCLSFPFTRPSVLIFFPFISPLLYFPHVSKHLAINTTKKWMETKTDADGRADNVTTTLYRTMIMSSSSAGCLSGSRMRYGTTPKPSGNFAKK